jgi:lipopolysaccharide/colanic/teichoic acid biosynthesis glycosyltransferase
VLDVRYVDQWSLWLDIRILGVTLKRVLRRDGISHPGHVTMEEFMGVETEL